MSAVEESNTLQVSQLDNYDGERIDLCSEYGQTSLDQLANQLVSMSNNPHLRTYLGCIMWYITPMTVTNLIRPGWSLR